MEGTPSPGPLFEVRRTWEVRRTLSHLTIQEEHRQPSLDESFDCYYNTDTIKQQAKGKRRGWIRLQWLHAHPPLSH